MDPALSHKKVDLDLSTLPEDPEGMLNIFFPFPATLIHADENSLLKKIRQ
jgi:hypothetical protein